MSNVRISLDVEDMRASGDEARSQITGVLVASPPSLDEGSTAYERWGHEVVLPLTGAAPEPDGSCSFWYDVTITHSSEPQLVGRRFTFGY
jgi:hypothetical protein